MNVFRQRGAVGAVIRRIRTHIPTVHELSLPPLLNEVAGKKRGLVLVVGATGSGKSTTLAAMLDHRNSTSAGHIITVEDPIEFIHPHKRSIVTQREVGLDTTSYHEALKNALRQAPDVILIGEVRDRSTMEAALTFAETGHLVLATLHSNNAYQAFERILNFFPAEQHKQILLQLSLNLEAVIAQRLVPAIHGTRMPACEVLLTSARVRDLLHRGEIGELKEAMEKSTTVGMCTFDQALFALYQAGQITAEEMFRHCDSETNLRLRMKLSETSFAAPPNAFKPHL
jgi:twitching motility protein PilU